jgi:hypothetical protein
MAERFVSPGVFTQENDLSFLPQGIAEIGGAFLGPTAKGPAFVPTIVESADEFRTKFGNPTPEFYMPHAAVQYLQDAARATIVRVLGLGGYAPSEANVILLTAEPSASAPLSGTVGTVPFGLIFPASNTEAVTPVALVLDSGSASGTLNDFELDLTNGNAITTSLAGLSMITTDAGYWVSALGTSPAGAEVGFSILTFPRAASQFGPVTASDWSVGVATGSNLYEFVGQAFGDFQHASTPWIQSQNVGGKNHNLFKFHTFSDGNAANQEVKVIVTGLRPAASTADDQHGAFSIVVRAFDDTDARQTVLEQFDNLSLDPDSSNWVARRIGDQRITVDAATGELTELGDWPNNSRFVYIEMATGAESVPDTALPTGFAQLQAPIGGDGLTNIPSASYVLTRFEVPTGGSEAVENTRRHYGFDFDDATNVSYLNPIPASSSLVGNAFNLEDLTGDDLVIGGFAVTGSALRRFAVPFQGGFDGLNPARVLATAEDITTTNTQGFDLSLSTSSGSAAFKRAIDAVKDPEVFDINLVVLPGVVYQHHPYVATLAIDMCEDRGDCFYIMDNVVFGENVDTAVNTIAGTDTNYAGTYHPWVKVLDVNSNKNIWVPPSTVMPQVFAFNDKVAAEWFAPAGLNRGGITAAVQVEKRLARASRDDLYEGRVNPIALFPGQGAVAFGQKTLQVKASALDRINVRRLLIAVKKFIASSARFLVFEQNVEATRQRFLNIVNPFLASVQERSGLFAFRVIMDESNNTPDLIDRNILVGQLFLQPTRVAEFISLEFNILPTGATFPEGA